MRIARTETANTYRQSTIDFYKDKPFVSAWDWVLSGAHPRPDVCDDYHTEGPYDHWYDLPTAPHPYCMCDVVVITKSVDEIRMLYNAD
jgi:hypothetical protein